MMKGRTNTAELEKSETARKRAEAALRQSDEKYRLLIDSSSNPTTVYDTDGILLLLNVVAAENLGGTPDDFVGNSIRELHPSTADVTMEIIRQVVKSGEPREFETVMELPSGIHWFWSNLQPMRDASGKIFAVQIISYDITERKRTEETLIKSEERFRIIFESIADAVAITDLELKLTDINRAGVQMLGYSHKEELLGKSGIDIVSDKDRARAIQDMSVTLASGRSATLDYNFLGKDGAEIPSEYSVAVMRDSSGDPTGFVTIVKDITERKRAEEKLEHVNSVLRAIRTVNQLITTEKDRGSLLKGVCDRLIETRGYYNAWIALLDESGKILTHAQAGLGKDFLPVVERLKRGELTTCGQKALSQSGVVVTEDPLSACAGCPLSAKYAGGGVMTIRLEHKGKVYGVLSLSVPRPLIAEEEEQTLVREVASDIALALHGMEMEEERKKAEEQTKERVKELGCLYGIARIAEMLGITSAELYQEVVKTLPASWQYSEITCAKISIGDKEFKTENYRESDWKQLSDIKVHGKKAGIVAVCYLEEKPELDEGPFMKEERLLIDAVAERLGGITERKWTEEALRESEEKYRTILETIEEAYYELDIAGNFTFFNDSMCQLLGYPQDELMGMNNRQYMDEENARKVYQTFNAVYRTGKPAKAFGWEIIAKDGSRRFVEASVSLIRNARGESAGFRGIVRDISERKRAEERLKILFEFAPDGYYLSDLEGNLVDGNIAAEQITGYNKEELIGNSFLKLNLLLPEEIPKAAELLAKNALGQATGPDEFILNRKDGNQIPVEIRTFPVNIQGESLVLGIARDITHRKEAEEALRKSEEKWRSLAQNAPSIIMIVNRDGTIQFINRTPPGVNVEEVAGKTIYDYAQPQYHNIVKETIEYVLQTGGTSSYEVKGIGPGGHISWYVTQAGPITRDGQVVAVTLITSDITERKRAEEKLQKSEEMYRNLISNLADVVIEIDSEGKFAYVSSQIFDIFGYTPEESVGLNALDFVHPDDIERILEVMASMVQVQNIEYRSRHKDGHYVDVSTSGKSVPDGRGGTKLVSVARDITERKQAEEKLREERSYLENLINHANAPIIVWDSESKISRFNPAFEHLSGYTASEIIGQKLSIVFPEESQDQSLTKIARTLSSEYWESVEVPILRKDGEIRLALWNSANIYAEDGTTLLATIAQGQDITERRKAQEQLEDAFIDLAETVSRAMGSRDPYTSGHQRRVAEIARLVGEKMGLDVDRLQGLYIGGLLHDIGKISTPETLLSKPGELTEEEWDLIRAHTKQGYKILRETDLPWPVADMAVHHHERLDGSGYPHGISDGKLSLEVRILGVCDVVEAMSSHRPYRPARSKEEVVKEIKGGGGTKYDPDVVDIVLQLIENKEFDFGW